MELKYLAIFLLVGFAFAEEDDTCGDEEVLACANNYSEYAVSDPNEKEACRQVARFFDCIRDAASKCESDDPDDKIDDDIAELQSLIAINCKDESAILDSKECFKANELYFHDCIPTAIQETVDMLAEHEGIDEDVIACSAFTLSINCAMRRIEEKCGEKAKDIFLDENVDVPVEVRDACLSESTLNFFGSSLLEKMKKRK